MRSAYTLHAEDDDFGQAGTLYRQILSPADQEHLVSNIVDHMSQGVERVILERALKLWYQVDSDLGTQIAHGLGIEMKWPLPASAG
jgi:catalase